MKGLITIFLSLYALAWLGFVGLHHFFGSPPFNSGDTIGAYVAIGVLTVVSFIVGAVHYSQIEDSRMRFNK